VKAIARAANEPSLRKSVERLASKYTNWNEIVAKFGVNGAAKTSKKNKLKKVKKDNLKQNKAKIDKVSDEPKVKKNAKSPLEPSTTIGIEKPKFVKKSPAQVKVKTAVVKKLESLSDLEQLEKTGEPEEDTDLVKPSKKDSFFLSMDGNEVSSDEDDAEVAESENEEKFQDQSYKSRKYHIRNAEDSGKKTFGALNDSKSNGKRDHSKNSKERFEN